MTAHNEENERRIYELAGRRGEHKKQVCRAAHARSVIEKKTEKGGSILGKNAALTVRVDAELKAEVGALYRRLGITLSDAVSMFLVQSLKVGGLPFAVREDRQTTRSSAGAHSKAEPTKPEDTRNIDETSEPT